MAKKKKVEVDVINDIVSATSENIINKNALTEETITLIEDEKTIEIKEEVVEEIKEVEEAREELIETNETVEKEISVETKPIEEPKARKKYFGFIPKKKINNNKKPVKVSFDFFWNGQYF